MTRNGGIPRSSTPQHISKEEKMRDLILTRLVNTLT
jgi:hypothetical protein